MIWEESLLWEKLGGGNIGVDLPKSNIPGKNIGDKHRRGRIRLPGFSEPQVARHFTRLSTQNYGVDTDIYPLGSCTMKYNPKLHEKLTSMDKFSLAHPLQNSDVSQGVLKILYDTGEFLKEITGLEGVTLQPAAGAHGELVAMLMFKKYFKERGEERYTILIPDSAHGTNPASAALCGFKTRVIKTNSKGLLTVEAVKESLDSSVAGIMITNPSTLGIFEVEIREICDLIHKIGALVYGDGANLNALMGRVRVGDCGLDAIHMNLHKTFSTPHGGGGPGAGPVCVSKRLIPYLPKPRVEKKGDNYYLESDYSHSIGRVHSFYGNVGVVLRAYAYIRSMGAEGLKRVSEYAVLNANYIRSSLKDYYDIPYSTDSLHEVLFSDKLQRAYGFSTLDIAKVMVERGIHPPTIYFPLVVTGAMLLEPTESESKESLDHIISILQEISKDVIESADKLKELPVSCVRNRVDETLAARKPIITGSLDD